MSIMDVLYPSAYQKNVIKGSEGLSCQNVGSFAVNLTFSTKKSRKIKPQKRRKRNIEKCMFGASIRCGRRPMMTEEMIENNNNSRAKLIPALQWCLPFE